MIRVGVEIEVPNLQGAQAIVTGVRRQIAVDMRVSLVAGTIVYCLDDTSQRRRRGVLYR